MSFTKHMMRLADRLVDNDFQSNAEDIVAQILELNDMSDVTVVDENHPLYPLLCKLLRPGEGIEEKLADFRDRLALG